MFAQAKLNIKPTLKTIESYKLEALIVEDLKYNGKSKLREIKARMKEIPEKEISKVVYRMAKHGTIGKDGEDKNRVYFLVQGKANEKQIS